MALLKITAWQKTVVAAAFCSYLFFYILYLLPSYAFVGFLTGKVVSIHDGDTLTLLDNNNVQHRIRLASIDAPELSQAFGQRSRDHLAALVFGKEILVQETRIDKYKRVVGKILLDGKDINLEQIKAGYAWHYKKHEKEQQPEDAKRYAQAEAKARHLRLGLWQDPHAIPPWEYRKQKRSLQVAPML